MLPGETYNLTFAGPSLRPRGQSFPTVFAPANVGGTLIMGDASAPSTITLVVRPLIKTCQLSPGLLWMAVIVKDMTSIQDATGHHWQHFG